MDAAAKAQNSIVKKFRRTIWSRFTQAVGDYALIAAGDRVAVCISGGKDSMLLAKCMQELAAHGPVPFAVQYLVMDPGYRPENRALIEENLAGLGIRAHIFSSEIFSSVEHIEKSPCYLCARMRRGYLYRYAQQLGCNKIALGHHYDDVIETTLLSILYAGQVRGMMPRLRSTNFPGMELIRPLYHVREADILAWRDYNGLRFLNCACRFTEEAAADEDRSKRARVKALIARLAEENPFAEANLMRCLENVHLDTVLGYTASGRRVDFLQHFAEMGAAEEE